MSLEIIVKNLECKVVLLVFTVAVLLRLAPEILAQPFPLGYDVINYYIPVISNYEKHWSEISTQFPLYSTILYAIMKITGLSSLQTVTITVSIVFGFFAVSVYLFARRIFDVSILAGLFITCFTVLQMPLLRTSWDLHRDLFALTLMIFSLIIIDRIIKKDYRNLHEKKLAIFDRGIFFLLGIILISSDRMIGVLFLLSLVIYSALKKGRFKYSVALLSIIFVLQLYISSTIPEQDAHNGNLTETFPASVVSYYNPQNLFILFLVSNGILVPTALIGLRKYRFGLLTVIQAILLFGSFSWIIFSDRPSLLADRWIILSGVSMSIFASYGFIIIGERIKKYSLRLSFLTTVIAYITISGLSYAFLPYDNPFFIYAYTRQYVESFSPVTMQFNSIRIEDNNELLELLKWINNNTGNNSIIIGPKHLRGFMEIYLEDSRNFRFSANQDGLVQYLRQQDTESYLIEDKGMQRSNATNAFSISKLN